MTNLLSLVGTTLMNLYRQQREIADQQRAAEDLERNLTPPGFETVMAPEDLQVAADYWEEHGDSARASLCRKIVTNHGVRLKDGSHWIPIEQESNGMSIHGLRNVAICTARSDAELDVIEKQILDDQSRGETYTDHSEQMYKLRKSLSERRAALAEMASRDSTGGESNGPSGH